MTDFTAAYGERLRVSRKAKRLTQPQLAAHLGLSRSSIANVEAGKQAASAEQAVRTAELLDVDLYWLLTGEVNETWAKRCVELSAITTDLLGDIRDACSKHASLLDQIPIPEAS